MVTEWSIEYSSVYNIEDDYRNSKIDSFFYVSTILEESILESVNHIYRVGKKSLEVSFWASLKYSQLSKKLIKMQNHINQIPKTKYLKLMQIDRYSYSTLLKLHIPSHLY